MKILLSHGYFLHEDKAEKKIMMPYPPQGLLHIGTYLITNGMDCSIYDSTFEIFLDFCEFLEKEKPEYLGLYVNLMTRPNILKIIRFIRGSETLKNTVIILGGPDVRYHSKLYIEKGADYCVSGEGENTMLQLIQVLDEDKPEKINEINGLTFINQNQEIFSAGESEQINPLDIIPFPDFKLINLQDYFSTWKTHHGYSSITISTMRGCPYSCRWCSKAVFGKSLRRRSASSVVKEMARLQKQYSPDRYWFVDDVFTISKEWLTEFADAIQAAKLKIKYECITRADRMDDEIINMLKESGCFRVWIGAESGSQKILDLMARRVKVEVVREMICKSKKSGIETGTFLMLGYPGEKEKDILETVEHLKEASPDIFTITLSYPIPGTDFYDEAQEIGLRIPGAWGTYSDRDLDFKRAYKPRYYHYAIRYINHSVNAHKHFKEAKIFAGIKHSIKSKILRVLMIINK